MFNYQKIQDPEFFKENGLIAEYNNNQRYFKRLYKYLYIGVEMKRGALCIYYDSTDELPNTIKAHPNSGYKGQGYVSIRFI